MSDNPEPTPSSALVQALSKLHSQTSTVSDWRKNDNPQYIEKQKAIIMDCMVDLYTQLKSPEHAIFCNEKFLGPAINHWFAKESRTKKRDGSNIDLDYFCRPWELDFRKSPPLLERSLHGDSSPKPQAKRPRSDSDEGRQASKPKASTAPQTKKPKASEFPVKEKSAPSDKTSSASNPNVKHKREPKPPGNSTTQPSPNHAKANTTKSSQVHNHDHPAADVSPEGNDEAVAVPRRYDLNAPIRPPSGRDLPTGDLPYDLANVVHSWDAHSSILNEITGTSRAVMEYLSNERTSLQRENIALKEQLAASEATVTQVRNEQKVLQGLVQKLEESNSTLQQGFFRLEGSFNNFISKFTQVGMSQAFNPSPSTASTQIDHSAQDVAQGPAFYPSRPHNPNEMPRENDNDTSNNNFAPNAIDYHNTFPVFPQNPPEHDTEFSVSLQAVLHQQMQSGNMAGGH